MALDQFVDFADGETRKSVVVAIVNDTIEEYDEHFSVLLRAAPYALGEPAEAEITIYSDEKPTPGPPGALSPEAARKAVPFCAVCGEGGLAMAPLTLLGVVGLKLRYSKRCSQMRKSKRRRWRRGEPD